MTRADILRIAAESGCDVRTVTAYLAGLPVRQVSVGAIEVAIAKLGIVRGETDGDGTKRGDPH